MTTAIGTYRFDNVPLQLVDAESPKILIFMTACEASSEKVHHVTMYNGCMVAHGFWLELAVRLKKLPATRLVLIIRMLVEIAEGLHVDHPQVVEEALTDVVASKDVQLALIDKG